MTDELAGLALQDRTMTDGFARVDKIGLNSVMRLIGFCITLYTKL